MHQERYIAKIENIPRCANCAVFSYMRNKLACIGYTRPEFMALVNILWQLAEKIFNPDHILIINKFLDRAHAGGERGLIKWKYGRGR